MICVQCKTLNLDQNQYCVECNAFLPKLAEKPKPVQTIEKPISIVDQKSHSIEYSVTFAEVMKSFPYSFFFNNTLKIFALIYPGFLLKEILFLWDYQIVIKKWILLTIGIYSMSFFFYMTASLILSLLKMHKLLAPHKLTFDRDFFREENKYNKFEYRWSQISAIRQTKNYIFLIVSWKRSNILPKRIFNDQISWQYFIQFANQMRKAQKK